MFITLKSSGRSQGETSSMEQVASKSAGARTGRGQRQFNRKTACYPCQMSNVRCSGRLRDSAGPMRDCDRCRARSISCASSTILEKPRTSQAAEGHRANNAQTDSTRPSRDGSAPEVQHEYDFGNNIDLSSAAIDQHSRSRQVAYPLDSTGISSAPTPDSLLASVEPFPPPTSLSHTSSRPEDHGTARSGSCPCSCTDNILSVVQRLDDDEFHLSSLSLDEVIKLQKWILFQCCKAIECPACQFLAAVHTLLLIICTRITEMFECIHKRIRRVRPADKDETASDPSSFADGSAADSSSGEYERLTVGELFCGTSGQVVGRADCNSNLFPPEFQCGYSDEEQVHMIRILLQLQMRNSRGLLGRVDATSQARNSKVQSLNTRLLKAEANIESAVRDILEMLLA